MARFCVEVSDRSWTCTCEWARRPGRKKRRRSDHCNHGVLEARRDHPEQDHRHGLLTGCRDLTRLDLGLNQKKALRARNVSGRPFGGRMAWQEQARSLSSGDRSAPRKRILAEIHCETLHHSARKLLNLMKKNGVENPRHERKSYARIGTMSGSLLWVTLRYSLWLVPGTGSDSQRPKPS